MKIRMLCFFFLFGVLLFFFWSFVSLFFFFRRLEFTIKGMIKVLSQLLCTAVAVGKAERDGEFGGWCTLRSWGERWIAGS